MSRRLPLWVRLSIYSYLGIDDVLHKIGLLSKKERKEVASSEIARENKSVVVNINPNYWVKNPSKQ